MWRVDSPAAVCGLSSRSTRAPECVGFGSCGTWAQLLCGTWDLPKPGIKSRSPALQVDSLPSEPQEKPKNTGVGSLSLLQEIFPT